MTKKGQKIVIGNRQHILKFAANSLLLYIYIDILKIMKNESLLCFCATRFTAVAALQA